MTGTPAPEAELNLFTRELYLNPALNSLAPKQLVAVVAMACGDRPFMSHSISFPMRRHTRLRVHMNERRYGWTVHHPTESYLYPFFDKNDRALLTHTSIL